MSKLQLTGQVVIKADSYEDAKRKLNKFVKRGAVSICGWPESTLLDWEAYFGCMYITVYPNGEVNIHNHTCQPATWLKRVRDVENYRVKE